jgi:hypothetical protein
MKQLTSPSTRRHARLLVPLKRAEERLAVRAALKHFAERTPDGTETRFRCLGGELMLEKPAAASKPPRRFVRVVIIDYERRQILRYLVEGKGRIAHVDAVAGQPAFHPDEIEEALSIAQADERIARVYKRRGVSIGIHGPVLAPQDHARIVGLHYVSGGGPHPKVLANVSVDLSARRVLSARLATESEK